MFYVSCSAIVYVIIVYIPSADGCQMQMFLSDCTVIRRDFAKIIVNTPFCVSFWPLGITFVYIRHIDGATTGRLVTTNHRCAKLFGGPLLQLGIERKIQQYAKQIGMGTKVSSLVETIRHWAAGH